MTRSDLDNKDILTVSDVAAYLGISKPYAYEVVRQEPFKVIRLGKAIRIPKASFLKWVDSE
ncbi:MAG: helix-turn-helix domain-containing protein [Sarcina sp.]